VSRINPPSDELGRVNAIVGGRARRYEVTNFAGPLSIKAVIRGTATWSTPAGHFVIGADGCLVVHAGEEYSLVIDALQPVETFCVFFSHGFVEEAHHSTITPSGTLLDTTAEPPALEFSERLQFDAMLRNELVGAHQRVGDPVALDESIASMARRLAALHQDVKMRVARIPALRAATREEIRRRLERAVALIHGDLAGDLTLERVAREACLAPFHFHRLFTSFFGQTPHRYVTRLRLQRAAALLAGSERSVIDVAAECGFESVGSFTSLFTRHAGVPPARFRKKREAPGAFVAYHSPA
jgi:AraC-like DNA-binding protein